LFSALAPAMLAVTWMVGKSICGNDATGRNGNAAIPANATAAIKSEVATGRRMNGSERFIVSNRLVKNRASSTAYRDPRR
jgi:hypothetical protein